MTKDIIQFSHPQFGTVRGWRDEDGEAWLMGSDVARRLGYSNPPKAIRDHVDEEDKTLNETFIVNGHHPIFINESGTYALVLSSKLPAARAFKSWVTREVLPSIRKTGGYIKASAQDSQETIRQRAIEALGEALRRKDSLLLQKDQQIMQLLPKAEYNDEVLCSVSCRTTTQVAKDLGMTAPTARAAYTPAPTSCGRKEEGSSCTSGQTVSMNFNNKHTTAMTPQIMKVVRQGETSYW